MVVMMVPYDAQAGVRSSGASCLLGSSSHLSPLALEASNTLLPPLGSHRERFGRSCRYMKVGIMLRGIEFAAM